MHRLRLSSAIVGHDVKTAHQMGWASIKNGELAIEVIVVWLVVEGRLVEGLKDRGAAEPAQRLRCRR